MTPSPVAGEPDIEFNSNQQFTMYSKAIFFKDHKQAKEILAASKPSRQKALGIKVKGYNGLRWDTVKESNVETANLYKFLSPALRKQLLATGDVQLAEASPNDRIWGIDFNQKNAEATERNGV
jgi:ribA/ribD-fused uncharacterized protein